MTNTSAGWKRRRAERTAVRWPVEWSFRGEHGIAGELWDVSEHGVFLAPRGPFSPRPRSGDELSLLVSTGDERFLVEGWVRWVGPHEGYGCGGFGVAFHPMSAYVGEALAFALMSKGGALEGVGPSVSPSGPAET